MFSIQENFFAFWNRRLWLAPTTWNFIELEEEYDFKDYKDLYLYPIPITVIILLFRFTVEKYGFIRLGLSLGLKNVKNKKAPTNAVLEKAFKNCSKWTHKDITGLAKQTDSSDRQIERWLRLRKLQGKPSVLHKFCESCWHCFYYSNIFLYGLITLWNKPWFWNLDYCWTDYPYQRYTADIWWYYVISLSFYWSSLISLFIEAKRDDFKRTLLYHMISITLLSFSWMCNTYRICTLVLLTHDAANAVLSAGKASKYAKCNKLCRILFAVLVVTWIVTKLIYYPFGILHSSFIRAPMVATYLSSEHHLLNCILTALFLLNLYWTYSVSRLIGRTLKLQTKL